MPQSINVESWRRGVPDLVMTFKNFRHDARRKRITCDVECTDGKNTVTLENYSPSPLIAAEDTKRWADDILAYIEAGRLDGMTGEPDEYYDVERANSLWAGKYMSPLDAEPEGED